MLEYGILDISDFSGRKLYTASLVGKETALASENSDKRKTDFLNLKSHHLNSNILISKDCHVSNGLP